MIKKEALGLGVVMDKISLKSLTLGSIERAITLRKDISAIELEITKAGHLEFEKFPLEANVVYTKEQISEREKAITNVVEMEACKIVDLDTNIFTKKEVATLIKNNKMSAEEEQILIAYLAK